MIVRVPGDPLESFITTLAGYVEALLKIKSLHVRLYPFKSIVIISEPDVTTGAVVFSKEKIISFTVTSASSFMFATFSPVK